MTPPAATPVKARLSRVKITNFRAIGASEIEFGETVALVGQNGSGKSSVLRALNAFFNFEDEENDFRRGRHAYTKATQSVIEVHLTGLDGSGLPLANLSTGEVRARLKFKVKPVWECMIDGRWANIPPDFHAILRKYLSYVLIPIRRDHQVAHGESGGLLESAVEAWFLTNNQRDRRSPQIARVADGLQKRSLSRLERHLRTIAPMTGPFSFELAYHTPPDYRLLLQNLELSVKEGGQSIPLSESGSGTQSMAVFALYAYLAELQNTNYIIGFEEPEQNLHPQAQQQLIRNLSALGLQVVFTTHSPTIVDMLEHEHVVLCKRRRSRKRDMEVCTNQIGSGFFVDKGLDRDKYYKFHRRRNSSFLFADFVVVTESPIDSVVVEQLLREAGVDLEDLGMSIVTLDGVSSIPYAFHLLKALGIPSAYVVDKDYFVPYRNNNVRNDSLDRKGYPTYEATARSGSLLPQIVPDEIERNRLVLALTQNHTEAMDILDQFNFFCFRFALEVDLVAATATRERLYDLTNLFGDQRQEEILLKRNLKDQGTLLQCLAGLPASQLPNSFKRLRKELPRLAREAKPV